MKNDIKAEIVPLTMIEQIKNASKHSGKSPSELKVFLGLSGGVDSAVAAFLLKEAGYQVTCGFMRNWDSFTNNDIAGNPTIMDEMCSQEKDYNDAKDVADLLGLPLLRIDFIKDYWENVFTDFIEQYRLGQTPNPDILCNKFIKFSAFYDYARAQGFDFLATGHYANLILLNQNPDEDSSILEGANLKNDDCFEKLSLKKDDRQAKVALARSFDRNKDQTYFLAEVSQEALNRTIFPLAFCEKKVVRQIADYLNLAVAKKKDSTGICFIGERHFRQFLTNYVDKAAGKIYDIDTLMEIGEHMGCMYYTYGQRKGLNISNHMGPWFVCGKDLANKRLYVAKNEDNQRLFADSLIIENYNCLFQADLRKELQTKGSLECYAKFRYRQNDQKVIIYDCANDWVWQNKIPIYVKDWYENEYKKTLQTLKEKECLNNRQAMIYVDFVEPISSVSPGQEAVFYHGEFCGGGGRIINSFRQGKTWQNDLLDYIKDKEAAIREHEALSSKSVKKRRRKEEKRKIEVVTSQLKFQSRFPPA